MAIPVVSEGVYREIGRLCVGFTTEKIKLDRGGAPKARSLTPKGPEVVDAFNKIDYGMAR